MKFKIATLLLVASLIACSGPTPAQLIAEGHSQSHFSQASQAQAPDFQNARLQSLIDWQPLDFPEGAESVVVAVVDTGLSTAVAQMLGNVVPGFNSSNHSTNVEDIDGHGTAAAGVVAQLAPQVSLMPIKAFSDTGVASSRAIVDGVVYALNQNAKVINLSASLKEESLMQIRERVGIERFENALIVIAAGNDQRYIDRFFKSEWPNVVVVGATTLDSSLKLTPYSAYGPGVDLAAPAGAHGDGIATFRINPPGSLRLFNGTSAAAPVVAAVAALVANAHPLASGADIKNFILSGSCYFEHLKASINQGRFLNVSGTLNGQGSCGEGEMLNYSLGL